MKTIALALLTACVVSTGAGAGFKDGNKLFAECTSPISSLSYGDCLGYVQGVSDALGTVVVGCVPNGVKLSQVKNVVVEHLRKNPAERHTAAAALTIAAIMEAWCPLKSNTPIVHFKK